MKGINNHRFEITISIETHAKINESVKGITVILGNLNKYK